MLSYKNTYNYFRFYNKEYIGYSPLFAYINYNSGFFKSAFMENRTNETYIEELVYKLFKIEKGEIIINVKGYMKKILEKNILENFIHHVMIDELETFYNTNYLEKDDLYFLIKNCQYNDKDYVPYYLLGLVLSTYWYLSRYIISNKSEKKYIDKYMINIKNMFQDRNIDSFVENHYISSRPVFCKISYIPMIYENGKAKIFEKNIINLINHLTYDNELKTFITESEDFVMCDELKEIYTNINKHKKDHTKRKIVEKILKIIYDKRIFFNDEDKELFSLLFNLLKIKNKNIKNFYKKTFFEIDNRYPYAICYEDNFSNIIKNIELCEEIMIRDSSFSLVDRFGICNHNEETGVYKFEHELNGYEENGREFLSSMENNGCIFSNVCVSFSFNNRDLAISLGKKINNGIKRLCICYDIHNTKSIDYLDLFMDNLKCYEHLLILYLNKKLKSKIINSLKKNKYLLSIEIRDIEYGLKCKLKKELSKIHPSLKYYS